MRDGGTIAGSNPNGEFEAMEDVVVPLVRTEQNSSVEGRAYSIWKAMGGGTEKGVEGENEVEGEVQGVILRMPASSEVMMAMDVEEEVTETKDMSSLPDEIWYYILCMGISRGLRARDVCALGLVSRRLRRISDGDCVWEKLWEPATGSGMEVLTVDMGKDDGQAMAGERHSWKSKVRARYEREKQDALAMHRRRVRRLQSQLAVLEYETRSLVRSRRTEKEALVGLLRQFSDRDKNRGEANSRPLCIGETGESSRKQPVSYTTAVNGEGFAESFNLQSDVNIDVYSLKQEVAECREHIDRIGRVLRQKEIHLRRIGLELQALAHNPMKASTDAVPEQHLELRDRRVSSRSRRDRRCRHSR